MNESNPEVYENEPTARILKILKTDKNCERCVVCGEIVPKGLQVCNNCFVKFWTSSETDLSQIQCHLCAHYPNGVPCYDCIGYNRFKEKQK